jgi:hypothetical protein
MSHEAPQAPPPSADALRGRHFRAALRSRTAFWGFFAGVVGGFLVGAYLREPLVMAAAPVAAVLLVVLIAFASADRQAEKEFWHALAPTLGLTYWGPVELQPLTPLLSAGHRRSYEHIMQGALEPGLPCSLGHYSFHVRREAPSLDSDESSAAVWQSFPFTICVVELTPTMPRYPGVFVRPKRGLFADRHDWLKNLDPRKVDLESAALARAYDVLVAHDQDEAVLRELMSPSLIDWLARHPLQLGFELRAGVLCAYLPGHVSDAGKLTWFRDGVRHLVRAVSRELDETPAATL